jgi:predicted  nucleic acid-binding Zn-ribbon protein
LKSLQREKEELEKMIRELEERVQKGELESEQLRLRNKQQGVAIQAKDKQIEEDLREQDKMRDRLSQFEESLRRNQTE